MRRRALTAGDPIDGAAEKVDRFGQVFMRALFLALVVSVVGCVDGVEPLDGVPVDDGAAFADPVMGEGFIEDEGDAAPVAPLGPPYPIILVHGFSGWTDVNVGVGGDVGYFYRVVDDYIAAGADVTAPALPPYDASIDRAQVLKAVVDSVLARTHKKKVHLIAHSQGGVDSRVLITELGYADKVASLTTISTPHRGTSVADLAEYVSDDVISPAGRLLGWILGALQGEPSTDEEWREDDEVAAAYDPDLVAAIDGLRPATMEQFNLDHPDPVAVPIFSVAGVSNSMSLDHPYCRDSIWPLIDGADVVDPFFAASGLILSLSDGGDVFNPTPNDGLVTVESARWGIFLGCIPADHADEIGQIADQGPTSAGFDHRAFYLKLLEHVRAIER